MSKELLIFLLIFIFSLPSSVYSADAKKNPYANKNIKLHLKDFLAYEIVSDFHSAIESYNQDAKNLIKIKYNKNLYEIVDQKDKVEFDVKFVLKGDFYYNGKLTNLKEHKKIIPLKTVFFQFISDAEAAEPAG